MTRLQNIKPEQATGYLAETYSNIKKQMGGVVNLFQALGNSHAALSAYLNIGGLLKGGALSAKDLETIALVSAQMNGCEYCSSAHTALGKMAGLKSEEILSIRKGTAESPKTQSLISFAKEVISERGRVSEKTVTELRKNGFTDEQIPEIFLSITQNIYTNYFNNFNGTEVDFPKVEKI